MIPRMIRFFLNSRAGNCVHHKLKPTFQNTLKAGVLLKNVVLSYREDYVISAHFLYCNKDFNISQKSHPNPN